MLFQVLGKTAKHMTLSKDNIGIEFLGEIRFHNSTQTVGMSSLKLYGLIIGYRYIAQSATLVITYH